MSISPHVTISSTYTRSVNLERDSQSDNFDSGYIVTSRALRTLTTVSSCFPKTNQPRAWSLFGPYGSGKSSFALFLSHLLSNPESKKAKAALRLLKDNDRDLEVAIRAETNNTKGYVKVLISGTPERLSLKYLFSLQKAMSDYWQGHRGKKPAVFTDMAGYAAHGKVPLSALLELTKSCQLALNKVNCPGIIIVFDELGKFLEYESRTLDVNDAYFLQMLAEHAQQGNSTKILLFVLVHQSIEQYAQGVSESLKNEWGKIQGRFEEIPFLESTEQTLRVVRAAIIRKPFDEKIEKIIAGKITKIIKVLLKEGALPSSLTIDEAEMLFTKLYPLHPLSALILPQLCQLIAQNERTLFSYLGSREQSGFQDILERLTKPGDFVAPHHIFDYFLANQSSVNGNYLTQRRWVESVSVIERIHAATTQDMAVLKTIGLINLLGNKGNIRASEKTIESVFGAKGKTALSELTKLSAIVYRKFNNEYRVWPGSDFDLESKLQEKIKQLPPFSVAEQVSENQSLPFLVARKYSIENGALRYFTLTFVDALNFEKVPSNKQRNPQIFIFLSSGQDDHNLYQKKARAHLSQSGLVGYHESGQSLKSLVEERLALEEIERTAKQLSEDPIAKKELESRLSNTSQAEIRHVTQLIANPQNSAWTFKEKELKVANRTEFQMRLSEILEGIFDKAPQINNELINKNNPSNSAVSARNKLMSLMINVDKRSKPDLGIEKFPAEKGIYRSVLLETKIHQKIKGNWVLSKPPKGSSLLPVWENIEEFFKSTEAAPKSFQESNIELISPPYGVKAGLLPILWLSVYLVKEDELALFEDGLYVTEFDQEKLERFVKRPDIFSVKRSGIDGINRPIFEQYCAAMKKGKPKNILDIAKAVTHLMEDLPDYTQKTKKDLSEDALSLRNTYFFSRVPENLILNDIPKALGYSISVDSKERLEGFGQKFKLAIAELKQAHPNLVSEMQSRLAKTLGFDTDIELGELREKSQGKCYGLESYSLDTSGVRGLLTRINREENNENLWFENIMMFLGGRPSKKWTDTDRDQATYRLTKLSRQLTDLFKLSTEERRYTEQTDGEFDVYLLKSLKKGSDFIDEVVAIDSTKKNHAKELRDSLKTALDKSSDKELQLAALAQVVDEFLSGKRESEKRNEHANILEDASMKSKTT